MKKKQLLFSVTLIILTFICISCAVPKYATVTPELRTQFLKDLEAGKPNLDCDTLACDISWIGNLKEMISLHKSGQWEKLTELVMKTGYGKDLAYYFLGQAAEGMGYNEAALKYYQQSVVVFSDSKKLHHCRESGGGCRGLNLAVLLPQRIAEIKIAIKTEGRKSVRKSQSVQKKNAKIGNEKFNFKFAEYKDEALPFVLSVFYQDKKIDEYVSASEIDIQTMENTPSKGCKTFISGIFSGGANCCFSTILAISCGSNDYLYYVDSGSNLEDVTGDGVKELAVYDNYFKYYQPDDSHFLSGAESDSFVRYAIWTDNGWELAKPGKLKKVYTKLKNKLLKDAAESRGETILAIGIAYHALMSGENASTAKKLLKSRLPKSWKPITNKVFSDIVFCVSRDPRNRDLNTEVLNKVQIDSPIRK
ncbi:MAG: hypothetical protein ABFD75_13810 [Smithella sp.]